MILAGLLILGFSLPAQAAEKPSKPAAPAKAPAETAVPYLGPGGEKMTPEEYERVYKNYIQTSILLGYPLVREERQACDQALNNIFRQMGMFGYPVPGDAQQLQRTNKTVKGYKVETYELGGGLIQLVRDGGNNGLLRLVLVNSSATRATRKLSQLARADIIDLETDPKTGLERVKGVPVGFPHPFLSKEAQGLYVKVLRFNGKVNGCEPIQYLDNTWTGGFDLSDARCVELKSQASRVWDGQLSTEDFYKHELNRLKDNAAKSAMKSGVTEAEAKALVEKHFTLPMTSEITIVGSAMANLAQCNLVALGNMNARQKGETGAPADGGKTGSGKGAGSAE